MLTFSTVAQVNKLIIGRTTGVFELENKDSIRVFGFTNTLSGQVTLPGTTLEVIEGDTVLLDFWNISQGDPHEIVIKGIELTKTNTSAKEQLDQRVYHMEHGYYHFLAKNPGTYIYYCPINYPFNLQAGMFGVLIIRPQKALLNPKNKELLWCSFEMDTNWHNNEVMDVEYDEQATPLEWPAYNPKHFFINGKTNQQLKEQEMVLNISSKQTTVLRLANTGFWQHKIKFPQELNVEIKRTSNLKNSELNKLNQLTVDPLETFEIWITSQKKTKETIQYDFINPATNKVENTQYIPVKIQNNLLN